MWRTQSWDQFTTIEHGAWHLDRPEEDFFFFYNIQEKNKTNIVDSKQHQMQILFAVKYFVPSHSDVLRDKILQELQLMCFKCKS